MNEARAPSNALLLARRSGKYVYYREVTKRFELPPGIYVIITSTYNAGEEALFMLRVFTEKYVPSGYVCKVLKCNGLLTLISSTCSLIPIYFIPKVDKYIIFSSLYIQIKFNSHRCLHLYLCRFRTCYLFICRLKLDPPLTEMRITTYSCIDWSEFSGIMYIFIFSSHLK